MRKLAVVLVVAACALFSHANEPANQWVKQEKAMIGPDAPIAVVWSPQLKRFMSLGWLSSQYDKRAPYTYDELAFDPASGQWENWLPEGKDWGPKFGVCKTPGWKGLFKDAEGNTRPNWPSFYWLLGAASNCAYLPDAGTFLFYVNGHTFSYDPVKRAWKDLAAKGDPQNSTRLKTQLFWGSICYDEANKQVVLFGGGNADTERGDPGTWIYTPATNTWRELKLDRQPPPRANSQLAYDPVSKKVILFGGDQLDQTIADTWTFDGKEWTQQKPARSPSPRGGHALLWLPKAKKLLLLGGYSVNSTTNYAAFPYQNVPLDAWTYDVQADAWQLIKRFEAKESPLGPNNRVLRAAVADDDTVAIVDKERKLWLCKLDAAVADAAGTQKHGVEPGAVERRQGPYDPAWYGKDVPAADPAKVKADLEGLTANQWRLRPTPKRPAPNMDWGTGVFSPDADLILRFSGGHSAYSGTAPQVYDIKTDRYSIPFTPEFPIDWCYSNDQVPGEWSFKGNPWMTGHTYKSTGYDPNLKCMVFGPHKYTYFFDPKTSKWTRNNEVNPYVPSFYTVTLVTTPKGLVAWAYTLQNRGVGLWRLQDKDRTWQPLPLKGKLFGPIVDNGGMVYDSQRDRLLFFVREKTTCKMAAYSFATGEVSAVAATGNDQVGSLDRGNTNFREAVYLPKEDLVMIGATGLIYDCGKNAWYKTALPSDAPPITKEGSYNIGVMYDATRNLIWAVNTNSQVFVLKFDAKNAKLEEVK